MVDRYFGMPKLQASKTVKCGNGQGKKKD